MTKIISLTDLIIQTIAIDYEVQVVRVYYSMIDSTGISWKKEEALFWVTIPDPGYDEYGNPLPIPDNWFQLPSSYFPTLLSLQSDADTALTNKFLV